MKNFSKLVIQLPINLVDYRWLKIDIDRLKKKSKSTLIGRSVFLRGKLLKRNGFVKKKELNIVFKNQLSVIKKKYNITSNLELCVKYINSLNFLDYIIFGVENLAQTREILKYKDEKFYNGIEKKINQKFEFLDTKYIDISKL